MKQLIPRALVRIKNELINDARYLVDRRFRTLTSSPHASSTVTYLTYAGLANRLRAHYVAQCVAERLGRTVTPIWMPTKELASNGDDVFASPSIGSRLAGLRPFYRVRADSILGELDGLRRSSRLVVLDYDSQWTSLQTAQDRFAARGSIQLDVRPEILRAVSEVVETVERPCLGVHIRQGDFVTHTPFAKPLAYFEREIDAVCQERAFRTLLVASDEHVNLSASTVARFSRVVILSPTLARTQVGVAAEALEHVLALATSDAFIGSPQSSFSELIEALRAGRIRVPDASVLS